MMTYSVVSCMASSLIIYSYLDRSMFDKTSCSTDIYPGSMISLTDNAMFQMITKQLLDEIMMLLVMAGLETNPGHVSRMYLLFQTLTPEPRPPIYLHCNDGSFFGDFSIFTKYSKKKRFDKIWQIYQISHRQ